MSLRHVGVVLNLPVAIFLIMTARQKASAGRFCPYGPLGVVDLVTSGRPNSSLAQLLFNIGVGIAALAQLFFTPSCIEGRQEVKPWRGGGVGHVAIIAQRWSEGDGVRAARFQTETLPRA